MELEQFREQILSFLSERVLWARHKSTLCRSIMVRRQWIAVTDAYQEALEEIKHMVFRPSGGST